MKGDMRMKFVQILADIICNTLFDPKAIGRARNRDGAFTRNCGKLPYGTLIGLLLKNVKKTISASLDEFFHELRLASGGNILETRRCSQQAFSKARSGISHSIFQECFERMLDFLCSRESHSSHARFMGVWGVQPIAIDGSKIPLPNRRALLEKYGGTGRDASSPTALASVAFDVLNNRILDAQLEPVSVDERTLAVRHMNQIKNKARTDLLYTMFIFDRGYASKNLIFYIEDTIHARYLFRVRFKFNAGIDAIPAPSSPDGISDCTTTLDGKKIRVLKFYLPSGVLETLITNDFAIDKKVFRQLYFLRWPVEENYKLIKEKIGLTNFRGYTENSILQEFWISMVLTNLALAIKRETDGIIDSTINQKGNKHKYMTNMNELVGCIGRHIGEYMEAETFTEKRSVIRLIFDFAISHRVRDKKGSGESTQRKKPRKVKYHYNNKATH